MKDNKLPHFPFFARDWLTDERVMLMDLATQGAYIRLLCYQWLEKSIPANWKQLAALCGVTPEYFSEEIWPTLQDAFEFTAEDINGHERLCNPRLEAIRRETEERVAKAVANGRKGAAKRWKGHNGPPNSPPMADHSDPNAIHIQNQNQSLEKDDDRDGPVQESGGLNAEVYEALMFTFRFGHLKALDISERLGTTMGDLRDWTLYENAKGTKLARFNMKTFKNPRDIPEEKEGTDNKTQRKTFSQMDADEYAAKKADFEKEKEDDDVSGNSEDA